MSLLVPMITRGALGRNDLLNNYGTTNFVQPPINDLTGLMNRGAMMGGMPGMGMGGMSGMGGGIVNPSSVGGFVTGAAVGAVAMSAMQNGGLNGANRIDHPNGGVNRNMNQPQNGYPNNGYNNQPQNGYPNNGYNTQPQNGYPNNGYNNQPSGDPLDAIFSQPQPPQQNQQHGAWEPVRNTPNTGHGNFGVQQPVNNANASYASNPANNHPTVKRNRVDPTGDRLAKGQKYSIKDRDGRPAEQLKICFGWDVKDGRVELDASAFMLGDSGKVLGDEWFIFYGQPDSPDNGLHYKIFKDDPNSPDDAAIIMDLTRVDARVTKIALAVTIYEAAAHSLNFGMVQNLYARILDSRTNREIASFKMDDCYSSVTAMVLGELYRYKGEWKFNAVGAGKNLDLAAFCGMYGVALE